MTANTGGRRWFFTLILLIVVLVAGAVGGFLAAGQLKIPVLQSVSGGPEKPREDQASGLLVVRGVNEVYEPLGKPVTVTPSSDLRELQSAEMEALTHDSVWRDVLTAPETKIDKTAWYTNLPDNEARVKWIKDHLRVSAVSARMIKVQLTLPNTSENRQLLATLIDAYLVRIDTQFAEEQKRLMELVRSEMQKHEFELDSVVKRQLIQKETELGMEGVDLFGSWLGLQYLYEQQYQRRIQVRATLAGLTVQRDNLDRTIRDGKTPAEVKLQIANSVQFQQAKQRLVDADREVQRLTAINGEKDATVATAKKLKELEQRSFDEVVSTLRSDLTEALREKLESELLAAVANADAIKSDLDKFNTDLGKINKARAEYQALLDKSARLRAGVDSHQAEIRRIAEYRVAGATRYRDLDWHVRPQ